MSAVQRRLHELAAERDEALAQQTATAEILQIINSSPGNLALVFEGILQRAIRLCEAAFGNFWLYDGESFDLAAAHGPFPVSYLEMLAQAGRNAGPRTAMRRAVSTKQTIQIADYLRERAYLDRDPVAVATAELGKARTVLAVPMLAESRALGVFFMYRQAVRPFSDRQIAVLQNFAAQAVIAMGNARLLGELRARTHDLQEALEYQTATSDVLKVISRSTFDLQPVLDSVCKIAQQLCGAGLAGIAVRKGDVYRYVATSTVNPEWDAELRELEIFPSRDSVAGRALSERQIVHIDDLTADTEYGHPGFAVIGGARTALGVPLLRDGAPIGVLFLGHDRVQPFTGRQIELVRTFADQAVIAIENTRLITETREALEQQTATAEVLGVINSSPGNLAPVFEAMLDKALRLCEASFGAMQRNDGDYFRMLACRNVPTSFVDFLKRPLAVYPGGALDRLLRGESIVHIADIRDSELYRVGSPGRQALVDLARARTVLWIPLRKDGAVLGAFVIYRTEVRPFTEKQIALVQSFAAQAVIAMENARLLEELRQRTDDLQEALEYQTATSDVLKVISHSAFALEPVLDTLVDTSARLCGADSAGITLRDGEVYRYVAATASPDFFKALRELAIKPGRDTIAGRVALEGKVVHVADITVDPDYAFPEAATVDKTRTLLGVPLLRDGAVVGTLTLSRRRVEPFTQRQVDLVRTFADQAVIAVENARLIAETREALDHQTATAEVLQIINSSPGDLTPVFDAMLEKALRLCEASSGDMHRYEGKHFHAVASRGLTSFNESLAQPLAAFPGDALDRLVHGEDVIHIVDVRDTDAYRHGSPGRRAPVDIAHAGTALWVALCKDGALVGCFTIHRREVHPFTEKQIALVQSFAAQAVIAMETARLLDEIRQRQAELRITFDNMGDGVAMFDADLKLAAWNRNFQDLLDVPDAFLAERPGYADYIRRLAARGEIAGSDLDAEINRRLADVDQELRLERTRPDGRVIEVRRNPVPDGGFVLIYSDVTARRRAEVEIRAARDAAERALGELQAAQANLIQAEKMASLGQLTAGIAHEIKNPLNFVNNFASLSNELLAELKDIAAPALRTLDDDHRAELDEVLGMLSSNLDKIVEHGRRADGIVKSMLAHSRGGSGDRQAIDLNALIEESLNLAYHGARAQDQNFNITMERELDPTMRPVELVPQDITRVFLNLFGNGFYAANKRARAAGDGSFRPVLRVATRDAGDSVEIKVRDNGIGIPSGNRDKLFQPFFTTKPTGEGTGLGLSISYDIVTQQHGGTISVDSEEGVFTEFTVRLPRGGRAPGNREIG